VESEKIKDGIFQKIFSLFPKSAKAAWEFHRQNGSYPRKEKFAWLAAQEFPEDANRQNSCVEQCLGKFQKEARELVGRAEEVAGAGQMLAGLFGRVPLYVASVNPQEELDFLICQRGWRNWFAGCYGNPPFPKEQALVAIAVKEQINRRELLLIGDSPGDREAAEKAGSHVWIREKGNLPGAWKNGKDLAEKLSKVFAGA